MLNNKTAQTCKACHKLTQSLAQSTQAGLLYQQQQRRRRICTLGGPNWKVNKTQGVLWSTGLSFSTDSDERRFNAMLSWMDAVMLLLCCSHFLVYCVWIGWKRGSAQTFTTENTHTHGLKLIKHTHNGILNRTMRRWVSVFAVCVLILMRANQRMWTSSSSLCKRGFVRGLKSQTLSLFWVRMSLKSPSSFVLFFCCLFRPLYVIYLSHVVFFLSSVVVRLCLLVERTGKVCMVFCSCMRNLSQRRRL